jgi:hypothetical protein
MSRAASCVHEPGAHELSVAFREEVSAVGGRVLDVQVVAELVYARAIVPTLAGDVAKLDHVNGGVAMRTVGADVLVHPFVYRRVCRNGQIQAHSTTTMRISRTVEGAFGVNQRWVLEQVSRAVRAAVSPAEFHASLMELRSARERASELAEADLALHVLEHLRHLRAIDRAFVERRLRSAFLQLGRDGRSRAHVSSYDLLNAITALARDTSDPETRWRLEELGGAIGAGRATVALPL